MEQPPVTADVLICGRWNDYFCDWLMLLPWWQMELATVGMCQCIKADVITLLADVIAMSLYFNFSSVLLTRTSSHIWGRWYLPMFLFRDGLLTLMYIDSLINLERPVLFPAHYIEVVKCGGMTSDVAMVIYRGGGL